MKIVAMGKKYPKGKPYKPLYKPMVYYNHIFDNKEDTNPFHYFAEAINFQLHDFQKKVEIDIQKYKHQRNMGNISDKYIKKAKKSQKNIEKIEKKLSSVSKDREEMIEAFTKRDQIEQLGRAVKMANEADELMLDLDLSDLEESVAEYDAQGRDLDLELGELNIECDQDGLPILDSTVNIEPEETKVKKTSPHDKRQEEREVEYLMAMDLLNNVVGGQRLGDDPVKDTILLEQSKEKCLARLAELTEKINEYKKIHGPTVDGSLNRTLDLIDEQFGILNLISLAKDLNVAMVNDRELPNNIENIASTVVLVSSLQDKIKKYDFKTQYKERILLDISSKEIWPDSKHRLVLDSSMLHIQGRHIDNMLNLKRDDVKTDKLGDLLDVLMEQEYNANQDVYEAEYAKINRAIKDEVNDIIFKMQIKHHEYPLTEFMEITEKLERKESDVGQEHANIESAIKMLKKLDCCTANKRRKLTGLINDLDNKVAKAEKNADLGEKAIEGNRQDLNKQIKKEEKELRSVLGSLSSIIDKMEKKHPEQDPENFARIRSMLVQPEGNKINSKSINNAIAQLKLLECCSEAKKQDLDELQTRVISSYSALEEIFEPAISTSNRHVESGNRESIYEHISTSSRDYHIDHESTLTVMINRSRNNIFNKAVEIMLEQLDEAGMLENLTDTQYANVLGAIQHNLSESFKKIDMESGISSELEVLREILEIKIDEETGAVLCLNAVDIANGGDMGAKTRLDDVEMSNAVLQEYLPDKLLKKVPLTNTDKNEIIKRCIAVALHANNNYTGMDKHYQMEFPMEYNRLMRSLASLLPNEYTVDISRNDLFSEALEQHIGEVLAEYIDAHNPEDIFKVELLENAELIGRLREDVEFSLQQNIYMNDELQEAAAQRREAEPSMVGNYNIPSKVNHTVVATMEAIPDGTETYNTLMTKVGHAIGIEVMSENPNENRKLLSIQKYEYSKELAAIKAKIMEYEKVHGKADDDSINFSMNIVKTLEAQLTLIDRAIDVCKLESKSENTSNLFDGVISEIASVKEVSDVSSQYTRSTKFAEKILLNLNAKAVFGEVKQSFRTEVLILGARGLSYDSILNESNAKKEEKEPTLLIDAIFYKRKEDIQNQFDERLSKIGADEKDKIRELEKEFDLLDAEVAKDIKVYEQHLENFGSNIAGIQKELKGIIDSLDIPGNEELVKGMRKSATQEDGQINTGSIGALLIALHSNGIDGECLDNIAKNLHAAYEEIDIVVGTSLTAMKNSPEVFEESDFFIHVRNENAQKNQNVNTMQDLHGSIINREKTQMFNMVIDVAVGQLEQAGILRNITDEQYQIILNKIHDNLSKAFKGVDTENIGSHIDILRKALEVSIDNNSGEVVCLNFVDLIYGDESKTFINNEQIELAFLNKYMPEALQEKVELTDEDRVRIASNIISRALLDNSSYAEYCQYKNPEEHNELIRAIASILPSENVVNVGSSSIISENVVEEAFVIIDRLIKDGIPNSDVELTVEERKSNFKESVISGLDSIQERLEAIAKEELSDLDKKTKEALVNVEKCPDAFGTHRVHKITSRDFSQHDVLAEQSNADRTFRQKKIVKSLISMFKPKEPDVALDIQKGKSIRKGVMNNLHENYKKNNKLMKIYDRYGRIKPGAQKVKDLIKSVMPEHINSGQSVDKYSARVIADVSNLIQYMYSQPGGDIPVDEFKELCAVLCSTDNSMEANLKREIIYSKISGDESATKGLTEILNSIKEYKKLLNSDHELTIDDINNENNKSDEIVDALPVLIGAIGRGMENLQAGSQLSNELGDFTTMLVEMRGEYKIQNQSANLGFRNEEIYQNAIVDMARLRDSSQIPDTQASKFLDSMEQKYANGELNRASMFKMILDESNRVEGMPNSKKYIQTLKGTTRSMYDNFVSELKEGEVNFNCPEKEVRKMRDTLSSIATHGQGWLCQMIGKICPSITKKHKEVNEMASNMIAELNKENPSTPEELFAFAMKMNDIATNLNDKEVSVRMNSKLKSLTKMSANILSSLMQCGNDDKVLPSLLGNQEFRDLLDDVKHGNLPDHLNGVLKMDAVKLNETIDAYDKLQGNVVSHLAQATTGNDTSLLEIKDRLDVNPKQDPVEPSAGSRKNSLR